MSTRRHLCVALFLLAAVSPAFGQIIWNFTYSDAAGSGFNDTTTDSGQTQNRSVLRKRSLTAAASHLNRFLDGRGTINANLNVSDNNISTNTLASFGPRQYYGPQDGNGNLLGSFQNGAFYQAGRTDTRPSTGVDGSGQFNFGYNWNYANQNGSPASNAIDMVTVAIHELTHGLGFNAFTKSTGQGGFNSPVGSPDLYGGYARSLQRGNGPLATSGLYNTDINSTGFGSFTGDVSTLTNASTNTTNGLFFGGKYAREVYGGAVPLYAPNPFQSGSSLSHVNDTNAVMNPSVNFNTVKRFQPYEIAMLLDLGWNTYNRNGTTGNWADGVSALASSRWTTDSGIVFSNGFSDVYNINSSPAEAPVLPIYGQVTANNVINFKASGTQSYTSTNNFGSTILLSRINLNSTSSDAITIAGGTISFGKNSDGTPSVLVPKIVQNGSGAVTISAALVTNTVATQLVDGVQFAGHNGITVEGTGTGAVTLGGNITGTGGITKNSSTFNLTTSGANTYTGTTTVNAGGQYVNGTLSGTGNGVTVNGGTLGGTGTISRAITVNSGGTLEGGTSTNVGTLAVNNNVTVNSGGNLRAELSGATGDRLNMTGGSNVLTLANGSILALSATSFSTATTYTLADLDGTGTSLLIVNGSGVNADTTFTFTSATGGTSTGPVTLSVSGFSLTSGDQFLLRRNSDGDLVLTFTPVPEPAGILLLCGLAAAGGVAWRRWKK